MFAAGVASSPSGAVVLSTSPDSTVSIDSVWTGDLGLGGITVVVNESGYCIFDPCKAVHIFRRRLQYKRYI